MVGTAINKVLFDSIQTDLINLFDSKQDNLVTGSFTWNASSNTTVNLGFKPKFVIVISGAIHAGSSNNANRSAILVNSYGIMIEGRNDADVAFFENTFNTNGFTVKPLNTIATSYAIYDAPATYIAFK